jgi:hypothetical protein
MFCADHLAYALTPLRCHARIGRHAFADPRLAETPDRGQPVGWQFVEHDERAEGATIIDVGQRQIIGLAPRASRIRAASCSMIA